jgi:hypothetical protein
MRDLNRENIASNDSLIAFGNWGVSAANALCEGVDECQMIWVPTEELSEGSMRQSVRFECELARCAVLAAGLNTSPESMTLSLAEKRAAQAIGSE